MDQWWLPDDSPSLGESPDDVFGTLLQGGCPELSEVGLTRDDYADLERLMKEHVSTCQTKPSNNQSMRSPACSTNSEGSIESPKTPGEDIGSLSSTTFPDIFNHMDDLEDSIVSEFLQQNDVFYSDQSKAAPAEDIDDIINAFLKDFSQDDNPHSDCFIPPKSDTSLPGSSLEGNCATPSPPCSPDQTARERLSDNDETGLSALPIGPRDTSDFRCQFCVRTFKHKIGLKNHERSHLRGETHVCGFCGEAFRYKNKLRRHVNIHAKQLRICRYCGIVQADDYAFVQHEKQHKLGDRRSVPDCVGLFPRTVSSGLDRTVARGSLIGATGSEIQHSRMPWSFSGRSHPYTRPLRYNSV